MKNHALDFGSSILLYAPFILRSPVKESRRFGKKNGIHFSPPIHGNISSLKYDEWHKHIIGRKRERVIRNGFKENEVGNVNISWDKEIKTRSESMRK